jgi:asparagine synthetase B (glutamine-hydrolysing)
LHSIEGRVPFLGHRVAEAAARVPVNMTVKGIREKHVLREVAKDVLIPDVYDRQKHPFTTPPTRRTLSPGCELHGLARSRRPCSHAQLAHTDLTRLGANYYARQRGY